MGQGRPGRPELPAGAVHGGRRPRTLSSHSGRGIAVLTAFDADSPRMNLTDVVQRCALSRSAARRFLHTLIGLGYITQHGSQYELTPQVLELGNSYLPKLSVADLARINAPSALMVAIRVGSRIPARRTGLGRILLAALPAGAGRASG